MAFLTARKISMQMAHVTTLLSASVSVTSRNCDANRLCAERVCDAPPCTWETTENT